LVLIFVLSLITLVLDELRPLGQDFLENPVGLFSSG
jgi:hypothetical protein